MWKIKKYRNRVRNSSLETTHPSKKEHLRRLADAKRFSWIMKNAWNKKAIVAKRILDFIK